MNVSLTPALEKYVHAQVKSGRYGSASEVIRNAIRALQAHEKERAARVKDLRASIERSIAEADAGARYASADARRLVKQRLRSPKRRAA